MSVDASFGEKLYDATCKSLINSKGPFDTVAEIWTQGLLVKPSQERTIFVPFTEIKKIESSNYKIALSTKIEEIGLSTFGVKYDLFSQKLNDVSSDAIATALLMDEPIVIYEAPAFYNYVDSDGKEYTGMSRVRIYQTYMVLLPSNSSLLPQKFSFSSILSSTIENYKIKIKTEQRTLDISRMGNQIQIFYDKLIQSIRDVETNSTETIRSIFPSARYEDLVNLGKVMVEGKSVTRGEVESISPELWKKLEAKVQESPLSDAYQYLSTIGEAPYTSIGLRKNMENVYVWLLFLVKGTANSGGNALIMEVTSETGHATYLFKVCNRGEFANMDRDKFLENGKTLSQQINEAMITTGFRREPIYLNEEKLRTDQYRKYLFASEHLDSLKLLREKFFGRITHLSFESWKNNLQDALTFNTSTSNENVRYDKGTMDNENNSA